MRLDRLPHEPSALVDFYQQSLEYLGAVCERTWHNRVELVAEGRAAGLWNENGELHQVELHFPDPADTAPRDAGTEVFPGCPLTFRLAEVLRPQPLTIERIALAPEDSSPPGSETAAKRWHAQFPYCSNLRFGAEFRPAHTFALLALVRCEIQAIDQHWSLHRIVVSLPEGEIDDGLARNFAFARAADSPSSDLVWPDLDPVAVRRLLLPAIEGELTGELAGIRARQENYLRRELDRIDEYFASYEAELAGRSRRGGTMKAEERLAAAQAEHERRRADQIKRHEMRIVPHCDSLLLLAEPAWETSVTVHQNNRSENVLACYNPRSRRWHVQNPPRCD